MRLTVGPLPPAVYWRRRALVLGGMLAIVLLITYTCSGESGANDRKRNAKKAGSASASPALTPTPSPSILTPITGDSASATPGNANPYPPPANPGTGAGSASATPCADSEITVVPAPEASSVRQGVPTRFFIKIKNISARTCVRDVGSHVQELYIRQDTTKQWSSDSCEKRTGNDIVTFPPNHEVSYWLTWDGKATAQGCANRPWLAKGTYQLFGRLDTKVSEPVPFAVTG
jgi:hypothetical protein